MSVVSWLFKGRAGVASPERSTADGLEKAARMLRDGTLSVADFFLICTLEGVMGHMDVGDITTPITFEAFDADQPVAVLDVNDGYTVIPSCIQLHLEDSAGTDNEFFVHLCKGAKIGAGSSTAIVLKNLNSGYDPPTGVRASHTYTANGTPPTDTAEFYRWGTAFADANTVPPRVVEWTPQNFAPVVAKGPAALAFYASATTTQMNGFIKCSFAVLPSNLLF